MQTPLDRRLFLKQGAALGTGLLLNRAALAESESPQAAATAGGEKKPVRVGFVGIGKRGTSLVKTKETSRPRPSVATARKWPRRRRIGRPTRKGRSPARTAPATRARSVGTPQCAGSTVTA